MEQPAIEWLLEWANEPEEQELEAAEPFGLPVRTGIHVSQSTVSVLD